MNRYLTYVRRFLKVLMNKSLINRRIILLIDLFLSMLGLKISYFLLSSTLGIESTVRFVAIGSLVYLFASAFLFVWMRTFRGLIRHSNLRDAWRYFVPILLSSILQFAVLVLVGYRIEAVFLFSMNCFLLTFLLIMGFRILTVYLYNTTVLRGERLRKPTLIYGIGSHSLALVEYLNRSSNSLYSVHGFLTRDPHAAHTRIYNLPVLNIEDTRLDPFLNKHEISTLVFPSHESVKREQVLISHLMKRGLNVLVTPPLEGVDQISQNFKNMRPIQVEDLLGRDEINIDLNRISEQVSGKTILITGAAGSIGSELVRQLATFKPKMLLVFDRAETPLHNLRLELEQRFPGLPFVPIIGDVRNELRLDYVFRTYHPELVYHAAAYKHVPMMEENPCEAIMDNVWGTKVLCDVSVKNDVDAFVMVSTDKAVNPTNVMGASKRYAEIYVQSMAERCREEGKKIRIITTRFGNVLGSNGSVIPYFRSQIEKGGPVTVTHPDVIRYFMTIPEACRLVLEAASFGQNGEIYVFDMGAAVKIVDLARKMIELAGFTPDVDIPIEFVGLRPGEKLYEELLNDEENTLPTEHEKITIAQVVSYNYEEVNQVIAELVKLAACVDVQGMVLRMKQFLPEYRSKNSPFEKLDQPLAIEP